MRFTDRIHAGRYLAENLMFFANRDDVVVLALPRGGVPVAFEVARALHAPLDVLIVRKLGVPGQEELAMGAVASGGVRYLNQDIIAGLNIPERAIQRVTEKEQRELQRRERDYRDNRPMPQLADRTVILVDDGIATGASMWAAVRALYEHEPAYIVVAVPVASRSICASLAEVVDEVICPNTPEPMQAVGVWYDDFSPTTDDEVRDLLERASSEQVQS